MSASLSFQSVSRTFETTRGHFQALQNVNLEIAPGSFTALVGPSGCGKSTLLNIAAGLDTQFEGSLGIAPVTYHQSYLFQQPRLLPWLSTVDNVAFVLQSKGVPRAVAQDKAEEALQMVNLAGFEKQFPSQLSGGMQQRAALARALVVDPDVLLMDEPFAALDEFTARRMRRELLDIYERLPRTVIFVTHNILESCFLADRVVVMGISPGRIIDEVPIDLPHPRDLDDPKLSDYSRQVLSLVHEGGEDNAPHEPSERRS